MAAGVWLTWLGLDWFVLEDDDGAHSGLIHSALALAGAFVLCGWGMTIAALLVLTRGSDRGA